MKKIILIVFILIGNNCINSQTVRAGTTINISLGNTNLDYQFGPALVLDYSLKDLPISFQLRTRFYITAIDSKRLSAAYSNNLFSIGSLINYFPIVSKIEPYIGLGLFYNSNNFAQDGNATGESFLNYSESSNFSGEIIGGIKFFADKSFNSIIEVTRTLNNTGKVSTYDLEHKNVIKEEDISFNSIFIKAGILFKI